MSAAALTELLKPSIQAPKVVLLPDTFFFVRGVPVPPVTEGEPSFTPEALELALESLSPFPVQQLLHGRHQSPGATEALVFAAYRRRFSADDIAHWASCELVAPSFAVLLCGDFAAGTAVVYSTNDYMTALYFRGSSVAPLCSVRPVVADASEEERAALREDLLRAFPGTLTLLELTEAPVSVPSETEGELWFRSGSHVFKVPQGRAHAMDVRPREDLDRLQKSKARDLLLWRVVLGLAAVFLLLSVGEATVFGLRFYHKARQEQASAQRAPVDKIMAAQALATRIDELATNRLLPFEMLTVLDAQRPKSIQFVKVMTVGLRTMRIEALTGNAADISSYQAALNAAPSIAKVSVPEHSSVERLTRFTLEVEFKADGLTPAVQ